MEVSYRREEKRRDAPSHQHHRRRKTHGYAVRLPRRALKEAGCRRDTSQGVGLQEGGGMGWETHGSHTVRREMDWPHETE